MKILCLILMALNIFWASHAVKISKASSALSVSQGTVIQPKISMSSNQGVPIDDLDYWNLSVNIDDAKSALLRVLDGSSFLMKRFQKASFNQDQLDPTVRFTTSLLSEEMEQDSALERLLKSVLNNYLRGCSLIILVDKRIQDLVLLQTLSQLQYVKQIVTLTTSQDLNRVSWKSFGCQGILMLILDATLLIDIGNKRPLDWDYNARVIIAGLTKEDLEYFIHTKKAKKTEQIIGLVKSDTSGTFDVYMNEHFWGKRSIRSITTWKMCSFTTNANLFPDKISNLHQAVLDLFVFEWEPAVIYRRSKDNQLLERYGRDMEVVVSLSETLNFTIRAVEPAPNELFGVPINGTYNGLIGALHNEKVDIAAVNLWITTERMPFMGYSQPFSVDQGCILARVEPPLPLWQSPGLPFQVDTWIAILMGLILAGPVLHMIAQGSKKSNAEESHHFSLVQSILYVYGAHFSHPMAFLPSWSSLQIFIAFLWIYSIILTTFYKSNLTAFLTVTREPNSMQTMKELHESGRRVLGLDYYKLELALSEFAEVRALSRKYDIRLRFDETKEDVFNGLAVTMNSKMYLEFYVDKTAASNGKPVFRVMKECLPQHSVSIGYQTNSPLKPKFDQVIMHMFESGLSRRWFLESIKKYRQLRKQDEEASLTTENTVEDNGVIVLSMDHMQGVFILWSFGVMTSIILFAIECIVS